MAFIPLFSVDINLISPDSRSLTKDSVLATYYKARKIATYQVRSHPINNDRVKAKDNSQEQFAQRHPTQWNATPTIKRQGQETIRTAMPRKFSNYHPAHQNHPNMLLPL